MQRFARTYLLVPVVALLLVVIPSLLISFTAGAPAAIGQTVPPATFTPRPRPTRPPVYYPTRVPTRTPSPTPTPTPETTPAFRPTATFTPDARSVANGYMLLKVLGNRLSPTIYGITSNARLYRSPNDGGTWQLTNSRADVDEFIFGPQDPGLLYAGTLECAEPEPRLFMQRSEDGGSSWMRLPAEDAGLPLLVDPADSRALLAAGCDGIYASEDGGESWKVRSLAGQDGIPAGHVVRQIVPVYFAGAGESAEPGIDILYAAAYQESGAAVVLLSEDAGATWTVITPLLEGVGFRITSITADPYVQGRVWFSDNRGVWGSTDDGQFWSFSDRGLDGDSVLNTLVLHTSERLYLGTGRGLYTRPAIGMRWSLVGDRSLPSQEILGIVFTDSRPGVLWLNTANGVFTHAVPAGTKTEWSQPAELP